MTLHETITKTSLHVQQVLSNSVNGVISTAALELFHKFVHCLKEKLHFDLCIVYQITALLILLYWIQNWLMEIIKVLLKIPKIIIKFIDSKFNFSSSSSSSSSIGLGVFGTSNKNVSSIPGI